MHFTWFSSRGRSKISEQNDFDFVPLEDVLVEEEAYYKARFTAVSPIYFNAFMLWKTTLNPLKRLTGRNEFLCKLKLAKQLVYHSFSIFFIFGLITVLSVHIINLNFHSKVHVLRKICACILLYLGHLVHLNTRTENS